MADCQGVQRAAERGRHRIHTAFVDAPGRRHCSTSLPTGSAAEAADDLDRLILGLQPVRRSLTSFWLLLFRTALGIGMGAEWPAFGAALAMEPRPQRSRGFMGSVLQGSWGLGALLSNAAYDLLFNSIGWRALLLIGVLPALVIVYIRKYVEEPEVRIANRRKDRLPAGRRSLEIRRPIHSISDAAATWTVPIVPTSSAAPS